MVKLATELRDQVNYYLGLCLDKSIELRYPVESIEKHQSLADSYFSPLAYHTVNTEA